MKKSLKQPKKFILGVTGSFGTGKTTVAKLLADSSVKLVSADEIAHKLIKPGSSCYKKIIKLFGSSLLRPDKKTIDRINLSRIVFKNKIMLKKLNQIVHPVVIKEIKEQIKKTARKRVILDIPLLYESGLDKLADKVIVVKAVRDKQIRRLLNKTGLRRQEIIERIKSQIPLSDKLCRADFIIDNSGSLEQTEKQIKKLRRQLWKS